MNGEGIGRIKPDNLSEPISTEADPETYVSVKVDEDGIYSGDIDSGLVQVKVKNLVHID
jgi:hypothetical protein